MTEPNGAAVDGNRSRPSGIELLGRPTTQRAEVLQALIDCEGFVSAQALHSALVAAGSPVGLSTVYRTLTALTASGTPSSSAASAPTAPVLIMNQKVLRARV